MSGYPDFYQHGYEIVKELGRNREGGRITWLAQNIDTCNVETRYIASLYIYYIYRSTFIKIFP